MNSSERYELHALSLYSGSIALSFPWPTTDSDVICRILRTQYERHPPHVLDDMVDILSIWVWCDLKDGGSQASVL